MERRDSKGRILKNGEMQRSDGRYSFKYKDSFGSSQIVYAWKLVPTDKTPKGKREDESLREKEKAIQKDIDDGIQSSSAIKKMVLNTVYENYMATRKLKENTRINYINMWDYHVRDTIGRMEVVNLKPSHVKKFYSGLSEKGYARNTIRYLHDMIYPSLETAVEDDIIRKNPSKNTLLDYGKPAEERIALTNDQQVNLLHFIEESKVYNIYHPMFQIMIGTACRCGETIGLTWSDIDKKKKQVEIDHQLVYKDYGSGYTFHKENPKSEAGVRTIPMTQVVKRALDKQREQQLMLGINRDVTIDGLKGFIFTSKYGRPLMPSAVNNVIYNVVNAYNKLEKIKAENEKRNPDLMPKISSHNLRHTGCTRMAEKGMDPKVLQYIMGHSSIAVTMEVYNHITEVRRIENEILKMDDLMAM